MSVETSNPEMLSLPMRMAAQQRGVPQTGVEPEYAYLVHAQRARLLGMMERSREAITELHAALALAPDRTELYCALAAQHRALGQLPQALAALRRCVALHPDHVEAWLLQVEVLLEARRPEEAVRTLQDAVARHRERPELLGPLAELRLRQGEREAALDALIEQVWIDPTDRQALGRLLVLARALEDEETVDSALALARQHQLDEASIANAAQWLARALAT